MNNYLVKMYIFISAAIGELIFMIGLISFVIPI